MCSDPIKLSRDMANVSVAGANETNFYTIEIAKKEKSINLVCRQTSDMKVKWTRAVPLPSGTLDHEFESLLKLDSAFYLFTSGFSKESEQFQVYCTKLNNEGARMGDPALVHYTLAEGRDDAPKFGYALSPDKSKILVFFDPPFERKNTEPVAFKMYGTDLELIMEKDLVLPYRPDILQVHNFLVDNESNIFMLSGRNEKKSELSTGRAQGGKYVVFFYNYKENKLKEYDVNLKDKELVSAKFLLTKDQDIIVSGYYSDDFKLVANGTFFFLISAKGGGVKTGAYMPFTPEFNSKFRKENEQAASQSLNDFYLDELILNDDGSVLLVGEQYYVSEITSLDPITGHMQTDKTFNWDNVMVTKLESNGRQSWSVKIPKRQYSLNTFSESSYRCFLKNGDLTFFFNDNKENREKLLALQDGEATAWTGGNKGVVTRVEVSKEGVYARSIVPNSKTMVVGLSSHYLTGPKVLALEKEKNHAFCIMQ